MIKNFSSHFLIESADSAEKIRKVLNLYFTISLVFKGVTQDEELTNRNILNFAER